MKYKILFMAAAAALALSSCDLISEYLNSDPDPQEQEEENGRQGTQGENQGGTQGENQGGTGEQGGTQGENQGGTGEQGGTQGENQGGNESGDQDRPTGISVTPSSISLEVGQTFQLEAMLEPKGNAPVDPLWSSLDPDIASVDDYGLVKGLKAGTATIRVVTSDGTRLSATCAVTVVAPVQKEPRVCYMVSDNYGQNIIYADGKQLTSSSQLVQAISTDGPDIYYYVYDDGFYKEKQKIVDYRKNDIGNATLKGFSAKNGKLYVLLLDKSPVVARLVVIDCSNGAKTQIQIHSSSFSNITFPNMEEAIRVADDGTAYILSRCAISSNYNVTRLWTVHPGTAGASATVDDYVFFKEDSDVTSTVCDMDISASGSLYTLVSYSSVASGSACFVLYKDCKEVRRYEGYNDNLGYCPHSISLDGDDVFLMLKKNKEKAADIFKNDEKLTSGITNCQAGHIAADGEGGYFYIIFTVSPANSTIYHNATKLYTHASAVASKLMYVR